MIRTMKRLLFWSSVAVLLLLVALMSAAQARAETGPPGTQAIRGDETNSQEILRNYIQLQEQLHTAQLAIEQNRKESQEAATKNAEALAARLQSIEGALGTQRARELEVLQTSNRVMLFMGGTFAVVGFVAMLLMAYFQWRTIHGLAEISAMLPTARALGTGRAIAALGPGDGNLATERVEQSNVRLLGALDRLEKRIYEVERAARPALGQDAPMADSAKMEAAGPNNGGEAKLNPGSVVERAENGATTDDTSRTKSLLTLGQSMLDKDQPANALASFEQALALEPSHPEALVKKGIALERLQKLEEAVTCYDRAIAMDNSLTIAYLHKGGILNRMERFGEALECYEKALRTQEKRTG
jgi:tetratricopeptide (TPR) repeat protein